MRHPFLHPARTAAALCALGVVAVVAVAGAGESFESRIDCGGDYAAGETVLFTVSVENRSGAELTVESRTFLDVPTLGRLEGQRGVNTLPADEDYLAQDLPLNLPADAPAGDYLFWFVVRSESEVGFDSCDFAVR